MARNRRAPRPPSAHVSTPGAGCSPPPCASVSSASMRRTMRANSEVVDNSAPPRCAVGARLPTASGGGVNRKSSPNSAGLRDSCPDAACVESEPPGPGASPICCPKRLANCRMQRLGRQMTLTPLCPNARQRLNLQWRQCRGTGEIGESRYEKGPHLFVHLIHWVPPGPGSPISPRFPPPRQVSARTPSSGSRCDHVEPRGWGGSGGEVSEAGAAERSRAPSPCAKRKCHPPSGER